MPDFKLTQDWNGYKAGEIVTDPFTDEFNLAGQIASGVLVEINQTPTKKAEA